KPTFDPGCLRRRWRRWTEVVGWFALRRLARRWIRERDFEALHRDLLAACQEWAEADAVGEIHSHRLTALVSPWLTTRVLEQTDRTLLLDLMRRCREVDRDLNGRNAARVSWGWALRGMAAAGVVGLMASVLSLFHDPASDWLGGVDRTVRLGMRQLTPLQQLIAAGVAGSLLLMWLIRYARRA
ncbi:MAG TPA: hypothetical protein VKD90_30210, partial [Gemmataceae bacterium]|nr:hypothetical protein [Gemmataceae bacterium]